MSEFYTDDEVKAALPVQNTSMFEDLGEGDRNIEIVYKKRARNPHINHIIARVAPVLWKRLIE